jgi:hypothetical protein
MQTVQFGISSRQMKIISFEEIILTIILAGSVRFLIAIRIRFFGSRKEQIVNESQNQNGKSQHHPGIFQIRFYHGGGGWWRTFLAFRLPSRGIVIVVGLDVPVWKQRRRVSVTKPFILFLRCGLLRIRKGRVRIFFVVHFWYFRKKLCKKSKRCIRLTSFQ